MLPTGHRHPHRTASRGDRCESPSATGSVLDTREGRIHGGVSGLVTPHPTPANGHLLRSDLLGSEIDRARLASGGAAAEVCVWLTGFMVVRPVVDEETPCCIRLGPIWASS